MKSNSSLSEINIHRILRLIWENKGISRIEIATKLRLDKSTITKHVSDLKKIGLITEITQGTTGPQGGRKPIFLEITPNFGVVGGIEINCERFICCILNLHGSILFQHQEIITPDVFTKEKTKGIFLIAYNKIVEEAKKLCIPLLGIGVGVPALVNPQQGLILLSVPLSISEPYNFIDDIKDFVSVPICLENDARCCCYSEKLVSNVSPQNMLFLLLEYRLLSAIPKMPRKMAIGMGLILNGHIFRGSEFTAGEFRSIYWQNDAHGQLNAPFLHPSDESEDLQDSLAYQELAKHIAFLVNILNLTKINIGGTDAVSANKLAQYIQQETSFLWPYSPQKKIDIQIASLGSLSVSYGAASMYLDQIFPILKVNTTKNSFTQSLDILTQIR